MPRRDWRKRLARFIRGEWAGHPLSLWEIGRLTLWLFVTGWGLWLLLGAYQGLWSWHNAEREIDYQYHHRAQQNREEYANQIAQRCAAPLAPFDIVGMCLINEIETYRKQAVSDQGLEAQQEMARWTAVMGVVGVMGLPLSMLGLFALWLSLRQTRQAIATDREVGHAQVRAYLTVDCKPTSDVGPEVLLTASLKITNTGQSPAYNVYYVAGIFIDEYPMPPKSGDLIVPPEGAVAPSITVPAHGYITGEGNAKRLFSTEEIEEAMKPNGTKRLYLAAGVRYKDVFGEWHMTRFCAFLQHEEQREDGRGGAISVYSFELTPDHNEAN